MGHTAKMGCAACKASWDERGGEMGWPSSSAQNGWIRFVFFSNLFLMRKQFQKNLEIV
jgi:hypothetical protein